MVKPICDVILGRAFDSTVQSVKGIMSACYRQKTALPIVCAILLNMSPHNCNYLLLTQVSRQNQHERLIIINYVHIITNVLLTQLGHWNRAAKDIIIYYVKISSNYVNIISNYIEITLSCFVQWLTSVKSAQLVIISGNACAKDNQTV